MKLCTVNNHIKATQTSLYGHPLKYGHFTITTAQFALSLGKESSNIFSEFNPLNSDSPLIRTLSTAFSSPVQTDATLLANNSQHFWMLHVASVCTSCCMLLDVVAQSLKPVKLFSQRLPTFLLFRDRRSLAQQCWIRLHSSSNIVGATHAHYAWFTKTYGLYPSHDALQVPTLLGVVASVCTVLTFESLNIIVKCDYII